MELFAILEALEYIIDVEGLAHIFIDNLNSLYLINTYIKHNTAYNNHPDKLLLMKIVQNLCERIDFSTIQKIRLHTRIKGNDMANKLAKAGPEAEDIPHEESTNNPHYKAHKTPYWLVDNDNIPFKSSIKHLD